MAKSKNKKKSFSEKTQKKKENQFKPKALNPFEVHLNKEKLKVLGKKSKNEKGLPGISRTKSLKKRKHTLLQEYKVQNKTNKFSDKRIGERNQEISDADKALLRFAASRVKDHKKKNIFNLAEDEIITHRGQSLQEIEKFDNAKSDDEEEEGELGRLDSSFVKEAHFGGGIFSNTGKDGALSHKQLIDQLIEQSKKRKAEQQRIKEATMELTEKLDTEWKDLVQIVHSSHKEEKEIEKPQEKSLPDQYDKTLKELRFEKRGTVSDRLKTETELEQENKEINDQLEQERHERMQIDFDQTNQKTHRSADDLDDDYIYETDPDYTLSYDKDGKPNLNINGKQSPNDHSILAETEEQEDSGTDESNVNESDKNSDSGSDEDSLEDLKHDDKSDSEMEIEENLKDESVKDKFASKKKANNESDLNVEKSKKVSINEASLELVQKYQNKSIELPKSYDDLFQVLHSKVPQEQSLILEGMIKSNQGSKEQLGLLFAYLLQYLNDLFSEGESLKTNFQIFALIASSLYELAKISTINAHNSLLEVIKEKHSEFKDKKSNYPGIEILVFLKIISMLFTTSDYRHQVVTPSFVFIEQMLTTCKIRNGKDIAYGLFLCSLYLEFTTLSNRYLPSLINFLSGLLHMAIPKTSVRLIKAPHPFKPLNSQLVITKDCCKTKALPKLDVDQLSIENISDNFRITALYSTLKMLKECSDKYKSCESNVEIFSLVEKYLSQIPIDNYPKDLKNEYVALSETLSILKSERRLYYVIMEQKKPKALRLYEPKFEAVYDTKRHNKGKSKEKAENDKLLYKLKKERKGAMREIKRDKAFLARVKVGQKIRSDIERKEKVNRIFAQAASQQHELNALDRTKTKK